MIPKCNENLDSSDLVIGSSLDLVTALRGEIKKCANQLNELSDKYGE